MQDAKQTVGRFYAELLTPNGTTDVDGVITSLLADNFQHINTAETHTKAQFADHVRWLWQLVPNIKLDIQEMLQDGNRVVVRSQTSGNPVGNFFGLPLDGSKAFSILTIDLHTVENGQITTVYHLEEWTTALQQLQA